jgi:transcriptional regulator with XRE-family HTH domain
MMRTAPIEPWREFGAYLRALREARAWTLRSLARAAAVAPGYLSGIERGVLAPPSVRVMCRLAELLEVPAHELLSRAGKMERTTWKALFSHPAIVPILSTIPPMTLEHATMFCERYVAELSEVGHAE